MKALKKNLIIDAVVLVVYVIVANPALTGISFHEWLSLGLFVLFVIHCLFHYEWFADALKTIGRSPSFAKQGNVVLDILILVVFMVVMVSGLGVSGSILPFFGLYSEGYFFWDPLHSISAKLLLALLVIHMVVHWKTALILFKKDKGAKKDDNK